MENNTPQKTSFWDFTHKKIYLNRGEKFLDFFFGLIIASILGYSIIYLYSQTRDLYFFIFAILIVCFLLVYAILKRKFIFYSMLIVFIVFSLYFLGILYLLKNMNLW